MGHGQKSYSNGLEAFTAQEKFAGGEWWVVGGGGRPNLVLAQVQVFGPQSLDLLDLTWDLTWDLDLDMTLTICLCIMNILNGPVT